MQCIDYEESPRHGGSGGTEFKIVCPYDGAITGINYRSGSKIDQLEFICTSSSGRTTFGPYGGNGGSAGSVNCLPGHYISSIYGKSGWRVDRLGIRCRAFNDMASEGVRQMDFGGTGGSDFDDLALSIGARPMSILVRAGSEVDSIQITYGNVELAELCRECKGKASFLVVVVGVKFIHHFLTLRFSQITKKCGQRNMAVVVVVYNHSFVLSRAC